MTDHDCISDLLTIGSDPRTLKSAQDVAAEKLNHYDGEVYPTDGCAITLSVLLQDAGIPVPDTYQALALGRLLQEHRGWTRVAPGSQRAGDVGSTCGDVPDHGVDHIYLVLKPVDGDQMVIADNQSPTPHTRFASGKGHARTTFFLRAPAA